MTLFEEPGAIVNQYHRRSEFPVSPRRDLGGVSLLPLSFHVKRITTQQVGMMMTTVVNAEVISVDNGEPLMIEFSQSFPVEYGPPLAECIRIALSAMMIHELTECLLVDGQPLNDPHPHG